MIAVALFDRKPEVKYVFFERLPLASPDDFSCQPAECLDFADARRIADQLAEGRVSGFVGGYRWYRQAGGSRAFASDA
jgi:hypothetical protein